MQDNSEYIDRFLSGSMNAEEESEFRSRLKSDDVLYAEYLLETKGKEYIKANAMLEEVENDPDLPRIEAEVQAYLDKSDNNNQEQPSTPDERKFKKAPIAAMAAAVIIGSIFIIRAIIPDPNNRLYNHYYEPLAASYQEEIFKRGKTADHLEQGLQFYFLGEYDKAILLLKDKPGGQFFLGLSLLEKEDFNQATPILEAFVDANPNHSEALWYLGLAQIRQGEIDAALINLLRLERLPSHHKKEVEKILKKLK